MKPLSRQRFRQWTGGVLAAAILMTLCGCGHGGPEVVRVTGTVTQQGKPVPNLKLNFMPAKGRPSWAITDNEGRYRLKYNRERDGAVTGNHTVCIELAPPKNPLNQMQGPKPLPENLQKYGNPSTTPLQFEVTTDNQVIDIQLDPS